MDSEAFSIKNSLATKGAAILMMLLFHCFSEGLFETHTINFWPLTQSQVVNFAGFFKICVSLFAFVSGYGLYLSYERQKSAEKHPTGWVLEKLIRTLAGYWFVVILAWIVCTVLDNRPYQVYGFETSVYLGLWNMLVEFLGLTKLTGGQLLNTHWWYMSAAVVFVLLLPLIYVGFERIGCLCTIGAILVFTRILAGYPGGTSFLSFLPVFCFGMVFSKIDLFGRWRRFWLRHGGPVTGAAKFAVMLLLIGVSYKLYYFLPMNTWWDVKYNVFPLLLILFLYDFVFVCPALNEILVFLGKHAANIFLVHAFIRAHYANELTYSMGHFVLVILFLLVCSLICSIVIEFLKKAFHYDELIKKLLCAVWNVKISI